MIITLPTRIPWIAGIGYVVAMFLAMILEGTGLTFVVLFVVHSLLSLYAFNAAGGFSRIIGSYSLFYSVLTVTFGVTWKVLLRQAPDTNIGAPLLDMTLYTVSMALLCIVVHIVRAIDFRPKSLAVALRVDEINYSKVGIGCLIAAFMIKFLDFALGAAPGGLLSVLNQIDVFLPLGIITSTIGAIKASNGRSAFDLSSAAGLTLNLILGLLAFSKQGMLQPIACWLVGVAYMRFRLRTVHFMILLPVAWFVMFIVSPLSTLRNDVPVNSSYYDRFTILVRGLTHWDDVKKNVAESDAFTLEHSEGASYFGTSQGGLVERFTMLPVDDVFFQFSAAGHYVGYETIGWDFENLLPHFILPNKHDGYSGNYYVHEMGGGLAEDDYTTGISFSPLAEAYHIDGWTSVLILLPAIWIMTFWIFDLVVGDLRRSPWGLLIVVLLMHAAPESLLGSLIHLMGYGSLAVAFAMYFGVKLAPVLGALLYGKQEEQAAAPVQMRVRTT